MNSDITCYSEKCSLCGYIYDFAPLIYTCTATGKEVDIAHNRPDWCPFREVPTYMIKREIDGGIEREDV